MAISHSFIFSNLIFLQHRIILTFYINFINADILNYESNEFYGIDKLEVFCSSIQSSLELGKKVSWVNNMYKHCKLHHCVLLVVCIALKKKIFAIFFVLKIRSGYATFKFFRMYVMSSLSSTTWLGDMQM